MPKVVVVRREVRAAAIAAILPGKPPAPQRPSGPSRAASAYRLHHISRPIHMSPPSSPLQATQQPAKNPCAFGDDVVRHILLHKRTPHKLAPCR